MDSLEPPVINLGAGICCPYDGRTFPPLIPHTLLTTEHQPITFHI